MSLLNYAVLKVLPVTLNSDGSKYKKEDRATESVWCVCVKERERVRA